MARDGAPSERRSRRDVLLGVGALAAVAGGWQLWANREQPFAFEPIDGLPGWRQVAFDGVSGGQGGLSGAALVGIGEGEDTPDILAAERLCDVLFGGLRESRVPVAVFSDFYCPFCRVLIERLGESVDPRIDITWHELPLLGPASVVAARAAMSADAQGGYVAFQSRLMGSQFRPTTQFLSEIAEASGLDAGQLLVDMDSPATDLRLRESRAASRLLGVWGTPATVVGRTLVKGAISERDFSRLINMEAERGALVC